MEREVLCPKCSWWVKCVKENKEPWGFCLLKDLYTYTTETKCEDFSDGTPMTEQQYEDFNAKIF